MASKNNPLNMAFSASGALGRAANTVIYIHGIGPKPRPEVLRCRWDRALFGDRMGDRTRLAYWMIEDRHGPPRDGTCDSDESTAEYAARAFGGMTAMSLDDAAYIDSMSSEPSEREWLHRLAQEIEAAQEQAPRRMGVATVDWLTRIATRLFIGDAYDFFFDAERRQMMQQSLLEAIEPGGGPFVIVGHSQGSMVAYDVLRQMGADDIDVPLFLTIGSPLGLGPVKSVFEDWTGQRDLPFPDCVDRWFNIAAQGDIVAFDRDLRDDVTPSDRLNDRHLGRSDPDYNETLRRDPHSSVGYLRTTTARAIVREHVGPSFDQPVGNQIIGADVVRDFESAPRGTRYPVLIELRGKTERGGVVVSSETVGRNLIERIRKFGDAETLQIDRMERYVSANLSRTEVERLRTEYAALDIKWVWRDARKAALLDKSAARIQALPAHASYRAEGEGITWAVLDTGVQSDHPHFARHDNIAMTFDCTVVGQTPRQRSTDTDAHGHGTHVCAVVAGAGQATVGQAARDFVGIAPRARLASFKVLDDSGHGRDSYIIKALDRIADLNERAGELVIQGVNLSLGGPFDASVYGCGHTPICKELRRLWRQGVLVVIAAGNEGYMALQIGNGQTRATNLDLSINDPANLEEAIAVGSVHRDQPHTYGVSYFSSRGPTADGRVKPDVVAPGERIMSANSRWAAGDLYVPMSGTSMAAPHVSGVLAAFLSVRRDFIGYPDRVKALLLETCTDLDRDPYVQGRGLVNLMAMLSAT